MSLAVYYAAMLAISIHNLRGVQLHMQVVPYEMYAGALRMDGPSLGNLELLAGSDGTPEGSLLARIDTCASPGA